MLRDELKRFFYRMKITSFDGQHVAELTPEVLRLLVDVTISESSYSDAGETYPTLTLNFQETSYLPETSGLVPNQSSAVAGQFTNRPGSILDLRFDSEKGFTYVSKAEMESGITRNKRTQNSTAQPVVFLFQGNNKIEIEWGLLEPRVKSRIRQFSISTISVTGGGSGHGTITLTALDGTHLAKKASIDKGKVYVHADTKQNYSLKQVLFTICKAMDYDLEFDSVLTTRFPTTETKFIPRRTVNGGDTAPPDPKAPITQPSQLSIHDFVKDLANEYSSSYEFDTDPKTKRTILKFQYREKRYANVDRVFTYASQSDVVLNYKIDSVEGSFNPVTGASSTVDGGEENAIMVTERLAIDDIKVNSQQKKASDKVLSPFNPADKARIKEGLDRNLVRNNETTPAKGSDAVSNHATALYNKNKYNSTISLTTIGNPDYKPSLIQMENIGLRYSKKYRMFTVQHKLGNAGYTCTWSGLSHYAVEGGVDADEAAKDNEMVDVRLALQK